MATPECANIESHMLKLEDGTTLESPNLKRESANIESPNSKRARAAKDETLDMEDYEPYTILEEHLESDEALWELYEEWQRCFKVSRCSYDKERRFPIFKDSVKEEYNKYKFADGTNDGRKIWLHKFADMKDYEKPYTILEEHLESDEALWALYEEWQRRFNVFRDSSEKEKRFPIFKDTVKEEYEDKFADGTNDGWKIRLHVFADQTWEDFASILIKPSDLTSDSDTDEE